MTTEPQPFDTAGLRDRVVQALITHSITESNGGHPPTLRPSLLPPFIREKVEGNAQSRADAAMDVVAPALAAKDAKIRELEADLAVLQAAGVDPDETLLAGIHGAPGEGTTITLRPPERLLRAMVASMIDMLDGASAPNYIEFEATNPAGVGRYLVRVQRAEGDSPHALRRAAEERVAELKALLDIEEHNHGSERNMRQAAYAEITDLRAQLAATTNPARRQAAIEAVLTLIIAKHDPDLAGHCGTGDIPALRDDATDYTDAVINALGGA